MLYLTSLNVEILKFALLFLFSAVLLTSCSSVQTAPYTVSLPIVVKHRPERLIGAELENNRPIANYPEFPRDALLKQPASWYFVDRDGWQRLDNGLAGWTGKLWLTVKGTPPEYGEVYHPMAPPKLSAYGEWVDFVQEVVDRYAPNVETLYIEIWNEPDAPLQPLEMGGAHWGGFGPERGEDYANLVNYTTYSLRRPANVVIVAGALASTGTTFANDFISNANSIDMVSYHAYEFYPDYSFRLIGNNEYALRQLTDLPLICSETAYITYGEPTDDYIRLHNMYVEWLMFLSTADVIHYNYRRTAGSWAESQLDYGRGLELFVDRFR